MCLHKHAEIELHLSNKNHLIFINQFAKNLSYTNRHNKYSNQTKT